MTSGMFKVFVYEYYREELSDEAVAQIMQDVTTSFDLDSLMVLGSQRPQSADVDLKLSFVEFCSVVYSSKFSMEGRHNEAKLQVDLL